MLRRHLQLLLLHYKANADAQDNNGNTPLHLACMYGHEDVSWMQVQPARRSLSVISVIICLSVLQPWKLYVLKLPTVIGPVESETSISTFSSCFSSSFLLRLLVLFPLLYFIYFFVLLLLRNFIIAFLNF